MPVKKRNKGILKTAACETAGVPENEIRFKTIQCGLQNVLRDSSILPVFRRIAEKIGLVRHVSTMLANRVVSQMNKDEIHGAIKDQSTGLKTFHSQLFVAIKCATTGSKPKAENPYVNEAVKMLESHPQTRDMLKESSVNLPYDLCQNEFVQLVTASSEHVGQMETRMMQHFRTVILHSCQPHNIPYTYRTIVDTMASKAVSATLSLDVESHLSQLLDVVHQLPVSCQQDVLSRVIQEITNERDHMSDVLYKIEYTDKAGKQRTDSYLKNMLRRGVQPREVRLLLPHLNRLSRYQSDVLTEILNKEDREVVTIDSNEGEGEGDIELVEHTEDEDNTSKYREFLCINRSRRDRPRPFSTLPYGKLRASMVYYGDTEIKQLLSHIKTTTKKHKKRTRKAFEEDVTEAEPVCLSSTANVPLDKVSLEFIKNVFDMTKFKGCSLQSQSPTGFRTNGVTMSMTWGLASESCIKSLYSKGVVIPEPESPIDIGTEERGLFKLSQYRNDLSSSISDAHMVDIVAVDPGKLRPLQTGICPLQSSTDWIPGNRTDVQSWHVDRDSYLHHTGRTHSNAIEQVRRSKNQCYANALEQLRNHRKKTCDPQGVIDYMTVALDTLPVVGDEVMHISRSKRQCGIHDVDSHRTLWVRGGSS